MVLSNYRAILATHEQEYRDSHGADCQGVVQAIIKEITAASKGSLDGPTLKGLDTVSLLIWLTFNPELSLTWNQRINNWYGNNKSVPTKDDEPTLVPVGTHWNYRLVIQHLYREEIANRMKDTGFTPKDPGWVGAFQLCVSALITSLGGDETVAEKYGEMAKVWNEAELPQEVQQK